MDHFIKKLINDNAKVSVFLTNGIKLQGVIISDTDCSIVLKREEENQLVYKHGIATIMPSQPLMPSQPYNSKQGHDYNNPANNNNHYVDKGRGK